MLKITKVQADWLLEQFVSWKKQSMPIGYHTVEKIINDCTEKPFPEFNIELYAATEIEAFQSPDVIKIAQHGDMTAPITLTYIDVIGEDWDIIIPLEKFKEFTAKCNTIVEWLDAENI